MRKQLALLSLALLCFISAFGQEYPKREIQIESFVENLFDLQSENTNYEDLYESLLMLYINPLNLNKATREELRSLYVLSERQVNSLIDYRTKFGLFLSVYELQALPDFDLVTIYNLMPFVYVRGADDREMAGNLWQRMRSEPQNALILRWSRQLQEQVGYTPPTFNSNGEPSQRYLGDPNKLYMRYRINRTRDFSFGFTAEKDAGEQLIWDPATNRYGMDFWSAHLMIENRGMLKKLLIGDYQYQFGQGLVSSAGFFVGKGAEPITTIRRSSLGIRPYTSVLEGMQFRGGAATVGNNNWEFTGFVSQKMISSSLQVALDTLDNENAENFITSINLTGFHRTTNELARRGTLRERLGGASAIYRSKLKNLETGVMVMHQNYQFPLLRDDRIYNRYEFNGTNNTLMSWTGTWSYRNANFFSEVARSSSGGHGIVAGVIASLSSTVEMSVLMRDYAKNFHSFYSNSFGENTRTINEQGLYWGLKFKPNRRWTFAGYYDKFKFPWLTFRADGPSGGDEFLIRTTYQPSKTTSLFVQFREEIKGRNLTNNTTAQDIVVPTARRNAVIQFDNRNLKWLTWRTRLQFSSFKQNQGAATTYGYALIQDLNYDQGKLSVGMRFAIFETDDFDNRQYAYERNVLYAFSVPAYFGKGIRTYALVQYSPSRTLDFWAKLSSSALTGVTSIGSGLERINGRLDSDIVVQVRYRFNPRGGI